MNKNAFLSNISKNVMSARFKLKKHSPEILVVSGVVGTVVSTVMACKATTKISTILDDAKEQIDAIHEFVEKEDEELYSKEDSKKDLTIVYAKTGLKIATLYAPAIIVGGLSITSILSGHNILRRRHVALGAAYATIDKSFKAYRKRVAERFGDEVEKEIKYNIKQKTYEEVTVDEKGKEKKSKVTVNTAAALTNSPYAKFFDESSPCWEKDAESNLTFLRLEQNHANDLLRSRGYVFLNDVYERLGIPRTKAGQTVGWRWNSKNPDADNFIDFGIVDLYRDNAVKRDFVNGYERSILLDFNVEGAILEGLENY